MSGGGRGPHVFAAGPVNATDNGIAHAILVAYLGRRWGDYWEAVERFRGTPEEWAQVVVSLDLVDKANGGREPPGPPATQRAAIDLAAFSRGLAEVAAITGEEVRRWRRPRRTRASS